MKVSIIIPAKDEEKRLPGFLRTVIDYCRKAPHSSEIIVVDDGSSDKTAREALFFAGEFSALKVISLERNHGKGYAVKQGFKEAGGDVLVFLDADGSIAAAEIARYLPLFQEGYDIVIGSRVLEDGVSKVKARSYRRLMGCVFNWLVASLLIRGIRDTQCGFKMFRSRVVGEIFGPMRLKGFGFDLEILYLAQKKQFRIKEVSVNWTHVNGSKVRILKDSIKMFWNIIEIRRWYR